MPIFELTPTDISDPDWETSVHRDGCRIHAKDEHSARLYATRQFGIATKKVTGQYTKIVPWAQEDKVAVTEIPEYTLGQYSEGLIEIPDYSASHETLGDVGSLDDIADLDRLTPYKIVNGGQTPPQGFDSGVWDESEWDKTKWADENGEDNVPASTPKIDGQSGFPPDPFNPDTDIVSLAIKNGVSLQVQARSLLTVIEEFQNPDPFTNSGQPQLWLSEDAHTKELLDLLEDLRSELHRLNELLETGINVNRSALKGVISAFGTAGKRYLNATATTAGTGTGMLFVGVLGHYMSEFGLMPWDRTIEVMGLVQKK